MYQIAKALSERSKNGSSDLAKLLFWIRQATLVQEINLTLSLSRPQATVFLCEKRFVVLVAGRRWAKTTLAIWYRIVNACGSGARICDYIAPTYSQAKRIAWCVLKQLVPKEARSRVSEQELLIEMLNGSIIQLHGADRPDRLRGVGLDCVVLDEYADMKGETWVAVIRPALSNRKGSARCSWRLQLSHSILIYFRNIATGPEGRPIRRSRRRLVRVRGNHGRDSPSVPHSSLAESAPSESQSAICVGSSLQLRPTMASHGSSHRLPGSHPTGNKFSRKFARSTSLTIPTPDAVRGVAA